GRVVLPLGRAVQLGQGLLAAGVGDQQEVPALRIAAGGRLESEVKALLEQAALDWPGQVEALAHRPRSGQQLVRGQVAWRHAGGTTTVPAAVTATTGSRSTDAAESPRPGSARQVTRASNASCRLRRPTA